MGIVTTLLDLLGLALIVASIALIYLPAAGIIAGAGLIIISWRLAPRGKATP